MTTTRLRQRLESFARRWELEPFRFERQSSPVQRLEVRTELTSYDTATEYLYRLVESMGYTMEYYGQCVYHIYQE